MIRIIRSFMIRSLLVVLCSVFSSGYAQLPYKNQEKPDSSKYILSNILSYSERPDKFTGIDSFISFFGDDTIHNYVNYKLGKKLRVKQVHSNGQLRTVRMFKKENALEPLISYSKNGSVNLISMFDKTRDVAINILYYESGNIQSITKGLESDSIYEQFVFYDPGGVMFYSYSANDSIGGYNQIGYYPSGVKSDSARCMAGTQPYISWHRNGSNKLQGKIFDHPIFPTGEWQEWDNRGNLIRQYQYVPGAINIPDGDWKWFSSQGKLLRWEIHRNGRLESLMLDGKVD